MDPATIIQLVSLLLPYVVKILENIETQEELKEFAQLLDRISKNDDLPKIIGLIQKIK
jgi:hypothetical protein